MSGAYIRKASLGDCEVNRLDNAFWREYIDQIKLLLYLAKNYDHNEVCPGAVDTEENIKVRLNDIDKWTVELARLEKEHPQTEACEQNLQKVIPLQAQILREEYKGVVVDEYGCIKVKSLKEAADIISKKHRLTTHILKKTVLKPDGTEYDIKFCERVLSLVNTI